MRLVCLGDSLTEGHGIDSDACWVSLLRACSHIETYNSGISGDTTTGMIGRFKSSVIDYDPTHVIIMGGTNDIFHGLDINFIISNIRAMTRQARHKSIQSIIGIPPSAIEFEGSSGDTLMLNEYYNSQVKKLDKFRERLRIWCVEDNQPIIDFGSGLVADAFLGDGLHPNDKGHRIMFENARPVIENLMKL